MIRGRLCRSDDQSCLVPLAYQTSNMLERMQGLLGRTPLKESEALLIKPCSSVHSFGMSYALDLIYLNKRWEIIKTVSALKPWRVSACPGANMVIELIAGSLERLQLAKDNQLVWQDE